MFTNTTNFCTLISYPVTLLHWFISSSGRVMQLVGLCSWEAPRVGFHSYPRSSGAPDNAFQKIAIVGWLCLQSGLQGGLRNWWGPQAVPLSRAASLAGFSSQQCCWLFSLLGWGCYQPVSWGRPAGRGCWQTPWSIKVGSCIFLGGGGCWALGSTINLMGLLSGFSGPSMLQDVLLSSAGSLV